METDRLLPATVNGATGDYGSWSDGEHERPPGRRRMSYSVDGELCRVDGNTGERKEGGDVHT